MNAKMNNEVIGKESAKQMILGAKTPLEQVEVISRIVYKVGRKELPRYLNEWSEEGSFDFFACLLNVKDDDFSRDAFFPIFDVERNYLDVCCRLSIVTVIEVTEKCYRIAGRDLVSGMALEKLEAYLSRNPRDIDDAITYYGNHYPSGAGLSFVWLAALKFDGRTYWRKWLEWAEGLTNEKSLTAALHVLTLYPSGLDASFVVKDVVERIVKFQTKCSGDGSKGELYRAAENWSKIAQGSSRAQLNAVIRKLVHEGCASVLYYASQNLYWTADQQTEKDVEWWLSEFLKTELEHKGILESISFYLQKVIAKFPALAFAFIEKYCVGHKCNITVFENLCQELATCDECLRNQYFTKWLMADSIVLARSVYEVVSHYVPDHRLQIRADFGFLENPSEENFLLTFLRAIGWLYLMPETCVCFLVSCARLMTAESLKSVYNDFFYLVVLNYLDVYKDEIGKIPSSESEKGSAKYLSELESFADEWWRKIKEKGECPELTPSMRQRELCAKYQGELYGNAMKETREKSVVSQIARNIQLLHGRGWIVPTFTADGEKLQDSLLSRFSASVRISRLSEMAGHTLETRLTELRRIRWEGRT